MEDEDQTTQQGWKYLLTLNHVVVKIVLKWKNFLHIFEASHVFKYRNAYQGKTLEKQERGCVHYVGLRITIVLVIQLWDFC